MTNTNSSKPRGIGPSDAADPRSRFTKQAERLLREVPIVKVIGEYTSLRRGKKGLTGNCPRHEEPRRTLKVDYRANTFSCSFCGIGGDAIDFLERALDFTYGQALEELETLKYSDEHGDAA